MSAVRLTPVTDSYHRTCSLRDGRTEIGGCDPVFLSLIQVKKILSVDELSHPFTLHRSRI